MPLEIKSSFNFSGEEKSIPERPYSFAFRIFFSPSSIKIASPGLIFNFLRVISNISLSGFLIPSSQEKVTTSKIFLIPHISKTADSKKVVFEIKPTL